MLPLICEICREQIGRFNTNKVSTPLTGAMFEPLDDIHGYPHPFPLEATWEHFQCIRDMNPVLHMRHRPITQQDRILTDKGFYQVGSKQIPGMEFNPNVTVYSDGELDTEWEARKKKPAIDDPPPKHQGKKQKVSNGTGK
jgi:hypothetical protein